MKSVRSIFRKNLADFGEFWSVYQGNGVGGASETG